MKLPVKNLVSFAPKPPGIPGAGGKTGGIEEYAYSVFGELRRRGIDVHYVTSDPYSKRLLSTSDGGVTMLPTLELLERPVCFNPFSYLRLPSLVKKADLIQVNMPFPFLEWVAAILAKISGKPLLVTYHMDAIRLDPDGCKPGPLSRLVESLYRALSAAPTLRAATLIETASWAYARDSVLLPRFSEKVDVIHQGIDERQLQTLSKPDAMALRASLLGHSYRKLVVFVGRLVPYKGLPLLLAAVRALADPSTLFVIGGEGEEASKLRKIVADWGLTNVQFAGYIPSGEMMNYLYAADVFVCPSISMLESTSINLLYARALGTRVIATEIGGTGETIPSDGRRGLVVPAQDVASLALAIQSMTKLPFEKIYDGLPRYWSAVADEYEAVIREVSSPGFVAHPRKASPAVAKRPSSVRTINKEDMSFK